MLAYAAVGLVATAAIAFAFGAERSSELDRLLATERELDRALAEAYLAASVDCPAKAGLAADLRGQPLDAVEQAMTSLEHVLEVHPELNAHRVPGRTVPEIMHSALAQKILAPP